MLLRDDAADWSDSSRDAVYLLAEKEPTQETVKIFTSLFCGQFSNIYDYNRDPPDLPEQPQPAPSVPQSDSPSVPESLPQPASSVPEQPALSDLPELSQSSVPQSESVLPELPQPLVHQSDSSSVSESIPQQVPPVPDLPDLPELPHPSVPQQASVVPEQLPITQPEPVSLEPSIVPVPG
ncbi:hypothetical protein MMC28_001732 [Mycoblastus sanguinarius]|nr:hypothetical protein [Mycoblastus sanguinarius]